MKRVPAMLRVGEYNGVSATIVIYRDRGGYHTEGYGTVEVDGPDWLKFTCVQRTHGSYVGGKLTWRVEGEGITDALRRRIGKVLWKIDHEGDLYRVEGD